MWAPPGVSHFVQDARTGIHYEIEWDWNLKRAKISQHGTFGCAKVINRSAGDGGFPIGEGFHAHICANQPCSAPPLNQEAISNFGHVIHLQRSDWRPVLPAPLPPLPPQPVAAGSPVAGA